MKHHSRHVLFLLIHSFFKYVRMEILPWCCVQCYTRTLMQHTHDRFVNACQRLFALNFFSYLCCIFYFSLVKQNRLANAVSFNISHEYYGRVLQKDHVANCGRDMRISASCTHKLRTSVHASVQSASSKGTSEHPSYRR